MPAETLDGGAVAELALATTNLKQFERQLLDYLQPRIGFEAASLIWLGPHESTCHATALGYDEANLEANALRYVRELSTAELAALAGRRPVLDTEALPAQRRRQLRAYRELFRPVGTSSSALHIARWRGGAFAFQLGRSGGVRSFQTSELEQLGRVMPSVTLGRALHAQGQWSHGASTRDPEWWSHEWRLSSGERRAARLVRKGLRNAEIARLLEISPNTVRNRLATIFRKARVSSRAELLSAMSCSDASRGAAAEGRPAPTHPWEMFLSGDEHMAASERLHS